MPWKQLPRDQWQSTVLASNNPRVFIHGAVALAVLDADRADGRGRVWPQATQWLAAPISDDDLVGLLRVIELALHRGQFTGDEQPALRS